MNNENLINEFIAEATDHFQGLDRDLLDMEKKGSSIDQEVINRAFRAIHSIKGSAGFFGFNAIKNLSHAMENILNLFREGKYLPDSKKIDALFAGLDKLREMINNIEKSNEIPYDKEVSELNKILSPQIEEKEIITPSETPNEKTEEKIIKAPSSSLTDQCTDYLQLLDEKLIILEQNRDKESINPSILQESIIAIRGLESIAEKYGIESIKRITSVIRTILQKTKQGVIKLNRSTIDIIGSSVEKIRVLSKNPDQKDISYHYELAMLSDIIRSYEEDESNAQMLRGKSKIEKIKEQEAEIITSEIEITKKQEIVEKTKPGTAEERPKSIKLEKSLHEMVRINIDLIDRLMNYAGELVLSRNQLKQAILTSLKQNQELNSILQNLDFVTGEIQTSIMQMRMQPVGNLLNKFPRLIRDLARNLNKQVEMKIDGNEIELDKSIIEALSEPLTHLVRNCMDHGIEPPQTREELGKPKTGLIELKVRHEAGQVNISIKDDGKGIDPDKILTKAMSKGIISKEEAKKISDTEKINLIFLPGFSTAQKLSDISGRGVGMDVVRTNIEKFGGHLEIESTIGIETIITIRAPLTLAIIPSLIVRVCEERYAIPQSNLKELISIPIEEIHQRVENIGGVNIVRIREDILPLVDLAKILQLENYHPQILENIISPPIKENKTKKYKSNSKKQKKTSVQNTPLNIKRAEDLSSIQSTENLPFEELNIVCLQIGSNVYGLIVDEFLDNEEIVVKPLSRHIQDVKCIAGATIMGDSQVIMILDIAGIAQAAQLKFGEVQEETKKQKEKILEATKFLKRKQSILTFANAENEHFAIPQANISRLEKVEAKNVEHLGKRDFIKYRGEGLPLIHLGDFLPVKKFKIQGDTNFYVIIPKTSGFEAGIIASRIVDTMQVSVKLHEDSTSREGVIGSAIINGHLTVFLDTGKLLALMEMEVHKG